MQLHVIDKLKKNNQSYLKSNETYYSINATFLG